MFDKLFTPITIKDMTLRNRIIMPAMGTRFTEDRFVNEKHIAYHVARARGGSALNIVEVSSVHALSAPKMFLSIAEDKYIPKLKELTDAIHAEGGKAGIQLWQGGLAVSMDQTAMILLSSDTELAPGFTVPGISKEMIAEVVDCYGKAAARAVAAGFDCIEFHCAHNYLPHSFLSDGLNHRTDAYGGSLENRARFPLECIRAIRAAMPEGMPLFMRIDAQDDGFGEAGLTVEDTITFCNWAKGAGVDVLDVSRGNIVTAASKYEVPPLDLPRGFNVDNAARIRKGTGMLTIGVGRINAPPSRPRTFWKPTRWIRRSATGTLPPTAGRLDGASSLDKVLLRNVVPSRFCPGFKKGLHSIIYHAIMLPEIESRIFRAGCDSLPVVQPTSRKA